MLELAGSAPSKEIRVLREELGRFQNRQSDAVVQFRCIVVDTNLAAALDGQIDSSFLENLASNVEGLADAIRTARGHHD